MQRLHIFGRHHIGGIDMSRHDVTAFIFEGGEGLAAPLDFIDQVRQAAVVDHVYRCRSAGADRVIVVSDRPSLRKRAEDEGALSVATPAAFSKPFHFGQALREVTRVVCSPGEAVVCFGGGSGVLMTEPEWRRLFDRLRGAEGLVTANSLYSSDIIGFTPASILERAQPMPLDNQLAFTLREAGARFEPMEATTGSVFDIDTPADVALAALHPALGERAVAALKGGALGGLFDRARETARVLREGQGDVFLYGRVAAGTLARLEAGTKCRVRAWIEERGMRSLNRESGAYAMLGEVIGQMGAGWWFERMSRGCSAALIDTRVLFSHRGRPVSQRDRFLSDLGAEASIGDEFARELARQAGRSTIPVLLGGHSLVNGGVRVLLDAIDAGAQGLS